MKQFCMKIDLISQRRENVLVLPSNMAAMTSHDVTLSIGGILNKTYSRPEKARQLQFNEMEHLR